LSTTTWDWSRVERPAHPDERTARNVLELVASRSGVSVEALLSGRRSAPLTEARHLAMYLARTLTDLSLPILGRLFMRHHTSVLYGCHRVSTDTRLHDMADRLIAEIGVVKSNDPVHR
jgi:chromosomal replication initiator protein